MPNPQSIATAYLGSREPIVRKRGRPYDLSIDSFRSEILPDHGGTRLTLSVDLLELERRWRDRWGANLYPSPIQASLQQKETATPSADDGTTPSDADERSDDLGSSSDASEEETSSDEQPRPFFCLDMFPNPSLEGFSVNQLRGIAINDVVARYQRARGRDVFRPFGASGK